MAKKKIVKPQKGVATTSVASKKQVEREAAATIPTELPAEISVQPAPPKDDGTTLASQVEDWEDDKYAEEHSLQQLVDRLHDKGEKEVSRILKSIEYDKRLSATLPTLSISDRTREIILQAADQSDENDLAGPTTTDLTSDQSLLRLYVTYNVLLRLGFSRARIEECLTEGIRMSHGWEAAIEWMWLHLTEEECTSHAEEPESEPSDPPIRAPREEVIVKAEPEPESVKDSAASASPAIYKEPLFRSGDAESSESDSDVEPNLNETNEAWAQLKLDLEQLRSGPEGEKKKGKKRAVVLETPEMRRLGAQMAKLEKDYMFSRRDADSIYKSIQARRRAEMLEARLKGVSLNAEDKEDVKKDEAEPTTESRLNAAEESDSDEDLFGNMLDEPAEGVASETNTTILTRSMPIPKTFSFSGNTPKMMLKTALAKSSNPASIAYIKLSGDSRSVRVGLEISWSATRRRVWRMDELGCDDQAEAENYVATLALNALPEAHAVANWRALPPSYRELWEELETKRAEEESARRREVWAKIKKLVPTQALGKQETNTVFASPKKSKTDLAEVTPAPLAASERLRDDFIRQQASPAYQTMLKQRQSLPIASFRRQIIDTLESSQVVVLSGETGCGKSTQLPAYILEDQLSRGQACKIYVTEPRRISAISLAQRVSQELGERRGAVGTQGSLVGYSIRLEAQMSSTTRLAYVTNGIALRMLEGGSSGRRTAFDEVTHIVVDEVHERSIDSDFLLIVLKQLIQQRPDLKVVLMSATLDADKISAFFGGCPTLSVPGRTFPVSVHHLEDAVELSRYHIDESSPYAVKARLASAKKLEWEEADDSDAEPQEDPTKLSSAKYSASTVATVNLLDSRQIPYDLIVRLLETICIERPEYQAFSAAILIFMPGLAEIRKLNERLQTHGHFGSAEYIIFPLHSTISSEGQGAVFDIPPPGVRKIVISTNIAETGVTIPDVTCVIDTGKHREMRYDEKRQISRLVETYIARDNAKQRRGRAGRVQEGVAFHLFTKARHDTQMAHHAIPEMLRLSLQDLALRIKVLRVKLGSSIEDVLSRALDPPTPINIQRAVASLVEVKALTATEDITPMGRILSRLPMDVHLGKFIIMAAMFRCLDPALTIAATLNSKSPFITPFGFEAQASSAKRGFAVGNSDFLTLANVFASWRRASDNPNYVRTFCKKNYLSHQNLQQIEELRQQLLTYLIDSSLVSATSEQRQDISQARYSRGNKTRFVIVPHEYNANGENVNIVSAALAAGLYPKLLNLNVNGLQTITNQQPVAMHPSSINFKTNKADFGSNYLTYFTLMQSKRLYAWETGPVHDIALALLCGDNPDFKVSATALYLDRNVKYHVHPRTAIALKILRQRISVMMTSTLRGKGLDETNAKWYSLAIRCLSLVSDDVSTPVGLVERQ